MKNNHFYNLTFAALIVLNLNVLAQTEITKPFETKISSYMGVVHPIFTMQNGKTTFNFKDFYLVGFPTAVTIRKHQNFAYNLEFVPFIRSEKGVSKMSNFLFHPGITFFGKNDFTFTPRLGFETGGRFGFSTVFSKTMFKVNNHPINFIVPLLFRFGNSQKASATLAINIGYVF